MSPRIQAKKTSAESTAFRKQGTIIKDGERSRTGHESPLVREQSNESLRPNTAGAKRGKSVNATHKRFASTGQMSNRKARKRSEAPSAHPRQMNVLAQLQKTQSLSYGGQIKLMDAMSVQMQNSFLIKNHTSANFDAYYQMMRRRRMYATAPQGFFDKLQTPGKREDSPSLMESPEPRRNTVMAQNQTKTQEGQVQGKMPAARDGHSTVVVNEQLVVFGGDRHRMPFSDTFVYDLRASMSQSNN